METNWYDKREDMESTKAALTGGVPGFMTVEGVSFLSEGGGRTGMAGKGAKDHNGGLGMAILLK